jgi:toxin FitB
VTGWLLDTNVLSALGPGRRPVSRETADWFRARSKALYFSTISAAEVEAGIAKLVRTGASRRAEALRLWFDEILAIYSDRVLSFDLVAARTAGALGDAAQAVGRHPSFADIAIAAIAKTRELVVVTLNQRHFDPLGIEVFNPFALHSAG